MPPDPTATPRLSIVIPVYNEGRNIEPALRTLLAGIMARPVEILVVYDFAEDDTVPAVRALQAEMPAVRLVHNDLGRGVLNAMRKGLRVAAAPYVVITMADLSDEPQVIDRMLDLAEDGADLVAASRYMRGGRQIGGPLVKRSLSRAAGLSLHHVARIATHDATNSFKLYSRRLLDAIEIESTAGFALGIEITVKAHLAGFRITEVPTTWRDRTAGESRFRVTAWMPEYLRWYWLAMGNRVMTRGRNRGLDS